MARPASAPHSDVTFAAGGATALRIAPTQWADVVYVLLYFLCLLEGGLATQRAGDGLTKRKNITRWGDELPEGERQI